MSNLAPFLQNKSVRISKSPTEYVDLDCTFSENHTSDTTITSHPVEKGSNITDNVNVQMDKLHLSAAVSNTPVSLLQISLNPTRAEDAYQKLVEWSKNAKPLAVDTGLRFYDAMLLKTVNVTRDVDTSNIVALEMDFQELIIVESETAAVGEIKSDVKAATPKKNGGKKGGRQVKVSVLNGLIKSAVGL